MTVKASDKTYKLANLHAVLASHSQFVASIRKAVEIFDEGKREADMLYQERMTSAYGLMAGNMQRALNNLDVTLSNLKYDNDTDEDDDE